MNFVRAATLITAFVAFVILPADAARLRSQVETILGPIKPADTSGVFLPLNIVLV